MTPTDLTGRVIAHRNDRMGARIIAMLNAVRIARDYDLPHAVGWTTGGRTPEECREPGYIFDPTYVDECFFDSDVMAQIYDDLVDLSAVQGNPLFTEDHFRKAAAQGQMFLSGAAMGVLVLPWENSQEVAARLPGCISAFAFSQPVKTMIAEIDRVFAGAKLTAYHIRRGDIIHDRVTSNKLWPNKYIPREFYEVHLERTLEDPDARVLVFSDTAEEVARLKERSDRVVSFTDLLGDRDLTTGARDFLELFAMSRCAHIFGPPSSAFSQTARTIGGGTLEAVQDALSPADRDRAMELMTARLEDRSPLFLSMGDVGQCLYFLIEHQMAAGDPGRARRIIRSYMDDGLDKSFAYQLLCELAVANGDLAYCEDVRALAYQRPVYVDESLAIVNAYAALSHLTKGEWDHARDRLQSAIWFRPLEPMTHGALNLGLSVAAITPQNFYPFDPEMQRNKGAVFPLGRRALSDLNAVLPQGMSDDDKPAFHPWEIVVRDWRMVMGKRLSRAFSNKSKIGRTAQMLERSFGKGDTTPALQSALAVLQRGMGELDTALAMQRQVIADAPDHPLYRKRISDILFETGNEKTALFQLEKANELSGGHPCYMAELAQRLWRARQRTDSISLIDTLAATDHGFVEIDLMTAEMLRRRPDRLQDGLRVVERALARAHGAQRLMTTKARLLMALDELDAAQAIYEDIADWGLGTEHTYAEMYHQFSKRDRVATAEDLIARSAFAAERIRAMAADKG